MADITIKRSWSELASKLKGAVVGVIAGGTTGSVAGLDSLVLWIWNGLFGFSGSAAMTPEVATVIATILSSAIGGLVVGWFTPDKLPAGSVVTASVPGSPAKVIEVQTPAAAAQESGR